MSNKIAEAWIVIGAKLKGLKQKLSQLRGMLTKGIKIAFAAATTVALAGAAAIGGAIAGAIPLIAMGSDMEEMQSKFETVFGEGTKSAYAFSEKLSSAVGRSKIEIQGFMASLQDLFKPMGFSGEQAQQLSQEVTKLGIDLASFNNMTDAEAVEKLNAGLTGSHEVLKSFGVFINDNTLSLKLQEMGLAKNAQSATEQAKALARLAIIQESTTDAQGDAQRTSGSLANTWKRLKGELFDLGSTMGASLIPMAQKVVGVFSSIAAWAKDNQSTITAFGTAIGETLGSAFDYISGIVMRFVEIGRANWQAYGEIIMNIWNGIWQVISTIVGGIIETYVSWMEWIGQLGRTIFEFSGTSSSAFGNLGTSINTVFAKIKSFVVPVVETIKGWVESLIFTFMNWDLITRKLGVKFAEAFMNMKLNVATFAMNAATVFKWLGDNWQDIMFTTIDHILTALVNLGTNIRTLFGAIMDAVMTGSIDPLKNLDFKDVFEGAANTISKMPKLKEFVETDAFKGQLDEIDKEWDKRSQKWKTTMEKNAPKVADETKDDLENTKIDLGGNLDLKSLDIQGEVKKKKDAKKDNDAGKFTGVEQLFAQFNASSAKSVGEKQLDINKQMLQEQKKTNQMLGKKQKAQPQGLA